MMWKYQVDKIREALRCKALFGFMESLDDIASRVVNPLFENQRSANLRYKMLERLFANASLNLGHSFRAWKNYTEVVSF
jgi:hypothetical protein